MNHDSVRIQKRDLPICTVLGHVFVFWYLFCVIPYAPYRRLRRTLLVYKIYMRTDMGGRMGYTNNQKRGGLSPQLFRGEPAALPSHLRST